MSRKNKSSFLTLANLAWREGRNTRRQLLLYMSSIVLGVAALVAVDSFSNNITGSVHEQSRTLMGADIQISARQPFDTRIRSIVDSLSGEGVQYSELTTFASMIVVQSTSATRLVQVRAIGEHYPFYGTITTTPESMLDSLQGGANTIVDSALLTATGAKIGDSITIGSAAFKIIATLRDVPGMSGISAALGPRVYIGQKYVSATSLLSYGSTAEYSYMLKLPPGRNLNTFASTIRSEIENHNARIRTVSQSQRTTERATQTLSIFIGIVGLIALLLGGIGVASGVRAFVARKIDTVAILRCLGASSKQVLAIYVAQSAAMGLIGAITGAFAGVLIQLALPSIFAPLLPINIPVTLDFHAIAIGIAVGGWVAVIFSIRPLIALKNISPLQTLRRELDSSSITLKWLNIQSLTILAALALSILLVTMLRAPSYSEGVWISVAIAITFLILSATAILIRTVTKKLLRQRWPYVIRQGVANIYKPSNHTAPVIIALGFGTFLMATLYLVQTSVLNTVKVDNGESDANVIFFDIQDDQRQTVDSLIRVQGYQLHQMAPVVTMRISAVNNMAAGTLLTDSSDSRAGWALRREYRSTYRDSLLGGETLVKGKWFSHNSSDTGEVSLERGIAEELQISINDLITWSVQGVEIPTRVTSIRDVQWTRFEPNFFAVFSPGILEHAPKQFIALATVPEGKPLSDIQHDIVQQFPNVSSIDISLITQTLLSVLKKIEVAVRSLAVFGLAMGIPVLFTAIAATRRDRIREGVLLKTLGVSRGQVASILATEYAILGSLGALTGLLLALLAAWSLTHFVFKTAYSITFIPLLAILFFTTALTVLIGLLASRDVYKETAVTALRE